MTTHLQVSHRGPGPFSADLGSIMDTCRRSFNGDPKYFNMRQLIARRAGNKLVASLSLTVAMLHHMDAFRGTTHLHKMC